MSHRQEQKAAARAAREEAERREAAAAARKRRLMSLGAVLAVAAVAVVALVVISGSGEEETAAEGGTVAGAADSRAMLEGIPQDGTTLGDPEAELVLTEYADLQCPFCRDYALQVLPQLIEDYVRPGRLRMELKLLRFIGPDSDRGARAAYQASDADKMWDFVDLWFRNQGPEGSGYADDEYISGLFEAAGLEGSRGLEAIETSAHEDRITESERLAQAAAIDSTPSFQLGDEPGRGERLPISRLTLDEFRQAIDAELE